MPLAVNHRFDCASKTLGTAYRTLFSSTLFFLQEPVNFIVKLQKRDLNNNQKFSQMPSQRTISTL